MKKKILLVYYTQSGQLKEIVDRFAFPFISEGVSVEKIRVEMEQEFDFPWTSDSFFDAMPESVLGLPAKLRSFKTREDRYDLIVFAYQPWYLSPSIPASSILANEQFKRLLQNTPVVTLIGSRNMWLNSQERVKKQLKECGAKLVGNIALTDAHNNFVSAITILQWMLTGKKDRYLGVFPKPGISDSDIEGTAKFGIIVNEALQNQELQSLQEKLVQAGAAIVKADLMFIEARAGKLFSIWANLIIKKKNRHFWLILFKYYLFIALFVIAPIVLTFYMLIFKPFLGAAIGRRKKYFLGVQ